MHNQLVTGTIEYHSTLDVAALKKEIVQCDNEYQKKLELGREIKQIVQELNIPIASLKRWTHWNYLKIMDKLNMVN